MSELIAAFARAFVFTQLVEVPIYRFGARAPLSVAFGASALTHPIVWFVFFSPTFSLGYETRLLSAEIFAVVGEACLLARYLPRGRALLFSFLANVTSVVMGELSRAACGLP